MRLHSRLVGRRGAVLSRSSRLETLERRELLSLTPELVADLNTWGDTEFQRIAAGGNRVFFSAQGQFGASDGTEVGTTLLSLTDWTLNIVAGNLAYAQRRAADGIGTELWRTDGTDEGTFRLEPAGLDPESVSMESRGASGDLLYFCILELPNSYSLWRTDGTSSGTVPVHHGFVDAPSKFTTVGADMYFVVRDDQGQRLWKSDGTEEGTLPIASVSNIQTMGSTSERLFFAASSPEEGVELWTSDGTPEGTQLVKDVRPGPTSSAPQRLTGVGDRLFFTAHSDEYGRELWVSDGTEDGTHLAVDVVSGRGSLLPESVGGPFDTAGDYVYFVRLVQDNGPGALWASDGTAEGTQLLMSLTIRTVNGSDQFDPSFAALRGTMYFIEQNQIWTSDGTVSGTRPLFAVAPANSVPNTIQFLAATENRLWFDGFHARTGRELWSSDGTVEGTALTKDLNLMTRGSTPSGFVSFRGEALFNADDGIGHSGIWKTNGTADGTSWFHTGRVGDVNTGSYGNATRSVIASSDEVVFSSQGALWRSDGTDERTKLVHANTLESLAQVGSRIAFVANDGSELWTYDLTTGDQKQIAMFPVMNLYMSAAVGHVLFFTADGGDGHQVPRTGKELWKADFTTGETAMVKDIWPGGESSQIPSLVAVGDRLFFTARDGVHERELWVSDGTEQGTYLVKDIFPGNGRDNNAYIRNLVASNGLLYFTAMDGPQAGYQVWRSDGTEEGTFPLTTGIGRPGRFGFATNFQEKLYFLSRGETTNIWQTDGTVEGTGPADFNLDSVDEMGILNGRLLLTGAEGTWTSDGTREGTVLLTSASVPTASFRGLSPYEPGNVLVFPYSTPKTGSEPWKLTAPLGDTNFDLRVDLVDLNNVRDHLGGYGFGDADHDGDVDLDDFNAVRNQLGVEAPAGGEDRRAVSGAWKRDSSARDVLFAMLVREEGGGKSKRAARGKF